jgi:uncharacterized protein (TIRG00374 family)
LLLAAATFAVSLSDRFFTIIHDRLLSPLGRTRIVAKLREFHLSYRTYQRHKGELTLFFLLTFVEQLFLIVISWTIALALGVQVGWLVIAGSFPLALLVSRLPISLNGLGVFEGVFSLLMSLGGVSGADALAIALSGRVFQTLAWLPWWMADVIGARSFRAPVKPSEMRIPE